jgi:hypothetical protein
MPRTLLTTDVRVWRETDARGVNAILNHAEVRPWVADIGEGEINISGPVANDENILLMGKFGAVFFIYLMPGCYECHTQILPEGRGAWAHKFAVAVLDWMFARSNAWEVTTRVPLGHLGALTLARSVGFQHEFTSMDPCLFRGEWVKASILRVTIHEWAARSAAYKAMGERLHDQMGLEALRLGITVPPHADDDYHSAVAGAAIEMVRHGLMIKASYFYNRWSALSRHRPIDVVSLDPPVIKMDLGAMRIKEDGIEVVP